MSQEELKGATFINATGKSISQLYMSIDYVFPGKVYDSAAPSRKTNHSLVHYVKQLLSFVFNTKMKQLLSSISMAPKKTLQSVFSVESMAILVNSGDLDDALIQALEYNIPLLQIVILSELGEKVIKQKVLMSFTVAHLINENFVLYGDWEDRPQLHDAVSEAEREEIQCEMSRYEGIFVRKGELIYAFIPMRHIQTADESTLQENLTKVRNLFYQMGERSHVAFSNISHPPGESEISASSSMFRPNRNSQHEDDNFIDSDEEEWEAPPGEHFQQ